MQNVRFNLVYVVSLGGEIEGRDTARTHLRQRARTSDRYC